MKRFFERWLDQHPDLPAHLGSLLWTVLLAVSGWDGWADARRATLEFALAKARAVLRTERAYHRWVAELGGVYVPVSDRNTPIERLKDVPDRDAKSAGGLDLTLINPGCLIWRDVRPSDDESGVRSRAISFSPGQTNTVADPWENEAFRVLATGRQEVHDFAGPDGNRVFRFMAGIHTEPACLPCHADQGYQVGDLRGGIRIDVPLNTPEFFAIDHDRHTYSAGLVIAWILGLGGIQGAATITRSRRREREQSLAQSQQAEQALRRHQALLEAIYEHTPFMLCLLNERGEIERMNRSMASLVTRPNDPGVPTSPCQALGCTHETPTPAAAGANDVPSCQGCPLRQLIFETLRSGHGRQHLELTVPRFHKGQVQELRFAASTALVPVADRTRLLLCLEDITAKKHLEAQFFQAQKMEAIGQLAGGVAHDFNNILGASMLNLELLLATPSLEPGMKADLEELEKGTRRAAALTRQLLLFGRRETAQIRRVNLTEILKGLLKMLHRLLGEHIEITLETQASTPWIEADPGMIEQVVVNLCVNARDAMPKGGPLRLEVTNVDVTPEVARLSPEARVGSFLCLRVVDAGTGIEPETLTRIFEPFFTTKAAGKGTGLGLATVYGIVRQHQGWIEVQSQIGIGTTFTVYLPAAESPASASPSSEDPRALPRGHETILLVEDDASLLRPVTRLLSAGGYRVIQASNGTEALQAWREANGQIHLLLTDMVMPGGITGLDLAETLRRSQPSLKVIIASGYSPDLPQTAGVLRDGITFLPKPYDPATLARTLRHSLDAP